ncbi:MAG: amidohydrolase family protein [Thermoplasmata archaeon]
MHRIEADVLIPGVGERIPNGALLLDGSVISFAGPAEDAPQTPPGTETTRVPAVMPGMWETHGHFMGLRTGGIEVEIARTPLPVLASRAAKDVETALQAGFTSVREAGGLGVYLARVVEEGTIQGPHIYGPGAILSQTGGHGDMHGFPLSLVEQLSREGGYLRVCDGVPECLRAVREQLRRGARAIKICASGGVLSEVDHPVHQQFSDEELRAMVGEAGRSDRIVMAHCHGKPGIVAALEAGSRTIEHGSYLDEEAADLMIQRKALLVPTRFIMDRLLKIGQEMGVPDYAYEKLVFVAREHEKALRIAIKKGVQIALGTDIFSSGEGTAVPWGMNAQELLHLVDADMTPLQALQSATANGPRTLGPQAPRSGQLREGYDADVLAVTSDPLADIAVLTKPDNITHVWKAGQLVKTPSA